MRWQEKDVSGEIERERKGNINLRRFSNKMTNGLTDCRTHSRVRLACKQVMIYVIAVGFIVCSSTLTQIHPHTSMSCQHPPQLSAHTCTLHIFNTLTKLCQRFSCCQASRPPKSGLSVTGTPWQDRRCPSEARVRRPTFAGLIYVHLLGR